MAKFLVCTVPVGGHVNPCLPIVKKLIAHGHEVWWYTGARFKAKVEATGARYVPMKAAPDFDDQDINAYFPGREKQKGLNALKWDIKHVFIDAGPGQLKDLVEIFKEFPADVVLADFTFGAAKWFHEKGGPVWASFGHLPPTFSSEDTAPYGLSMLPNNSRLGRIRNRALNWLVTNAIFKDVVTYTDKKRDEVGLPA